jgi:hypothetical protein
VTQTIFCLCHRHGVEPRAVDTKILGWHASRAMSEAATSAYLDVPGFRRFPDGFYVVPVPIVVLLWPDGFDEATAPREFIAERADDGAGTMLRSVHIVWHAFENPAEVDHERLVGVFSTSECAARAVEHSLTLPGFIDHPDGFITGYGNLGERKWAEGFVTVDGREPPPLRSLIRGTEIECIDDAGRLLVSRDDTLVLLDEMGSVGVRLGGIQGFVCVGDTYVADAEQSLDVSACVSLRESIVRARRFMCEQARADRLYELMLQPDGRPLFEREQALLVRLMGHAAPPRFNDVWLADVRVTDHANGGRGGFRVVWPEPVDAGRVIAEVRVREPDGSQVVARLTVDSNGMPYDVDLFPTLA